MRRIVRPLFVLLLVVTVAAATGCGRSSVPTRVETARRIDRTRATPAFVLISGNPALPGRAVVRLKQGVSFQGFASQKGIELVRSQVVGSSTYYLVRSTQDPNSLTLAHDLDDPSFVDWTSPDLLLWCPEADREPMASDDGDGFRSSQAYQNQIAAQQVQADAAHTLANGSGVSVAILDTGLDPSHPVFAGDFGLVYLLGLDFTHDQPQSWTTEVREGDDFDGDHYVDEAYGHGTHVAGIVRRAAPGAILIAIRVLNSDGWGSAFGIASGIEQAVAMGAKVINLSLGMLADDGMLHEAIQSATSQGVVVVASAGNRGNELAQYPAAYSEAISVTSVDSADVHVGAASYGSSVDIAAPGVDIVSAIPHDMNIGDYAVGTGTSMATPWVSGAMALSFQYWSESTTPQIVAKVINHSDPIDYLNSGYGGKLGAGRVNLYRIMESEEEVQLPRRRR